MSFDNWLEFLKQTAQRKLYAPIRADHVVDETYQLKLIPPQKAYFEIRLSERFLHYRRAYGRLFVPFTVIVSEFDYGGKCQTVPFFVGNKLLKDVERYVREQEVDYRNTRVAGPIPYQGGDVALFVGLYRVQVGDWGRDLLDILGQVGSLFAMNPLSNYVEVAKKLADGFYTDF